MMINKRLINTVSDTKQYIVKNVMYQWFSLLANISIMISISSLLSSLYEGNTSKIHYIFTCAVVIIGMIIRFLCAIKSSKMSYLSSKTIKHTLREKIYKKLLELGASYKEKVNTSELV